MRDGENRVVCACPFSVVGKGDADRSLEREAELEMKLARDTWHDGESIELSLKAPYTGAGLITIEREKVLLGNGSAAGRRAACSTLRCRRARKARPM